MAKEIRRAYRSKGVLNSGMVGKFLVCLARIWQILQRQNLDYQRNAQYWVDLEVYPRTWVLAIGLLTSLLDCNQKGLLSHAMSKLIVFTCMPDTE